MLPVCGISTLVCIYTYIYIFYLQCMPSNWYKLDFMIYLLYYSSIHLPLDTGHLCGCKWKICQLGSHNLVYWTRGDVDYRLQHVGGQTSYSHSRGLGSQYIQDCYHYPIVLGLYLWPFVRLSICYLDETPGSKQGLEWRLLFTLQHCCSVLNSFTQPYRSCATPVDIIPCPVSRFNEKIRFCKMLLLL